VSLGNERAWCSPFDRGRHARSAMAAESHPAPATTFGLTGRAAEVQRVALAVVGITASRTRFVVSLDGERCYEGSQLSDTIGTAAHLNDTVLVVPGAVTRQYVAPAVRTNSIQHRTSLAELPLTHRSRMLMVPHTWTMKRRIPTRERLPA
jgi:hypothetical protein